MKILVQQILTDIEKMVFLFDDIGNRKLLHGEELYLDFKKNAPLDSPLDEILSKKGKIRQGFYAEINTNMQDYLCDGLFYLPFIFQHFDEKIFNQIWHGINKEKFLVSNRIFLNPYTIFKINNENMTEHALFCLNEKDLLSTERVIEFKSKKSCFKPGSLSDIKPVFAFSKYNEILVNLAEYHFLTKLDDTNIEIFKNNGVLLRPEKIILAMNIIKSDIDKDFSADQQKGALSLLSMIEKKLLTYQMKDSEFLKNNYIQRL